MCPHHELVADGDPCPPLDGMSVMLSHICVAFALQVLTIQTRATGEKKILRQCIQQIWNIAGALVLELLDSPNAPFHGAQYTGTL